MDLFLIYLWLKLDTLLNVSGVFCLIFTAFFIGVGIFRVDNSSFSKNAATLHNRVGAVSLCFLFLWMFLPSSKDVAVLVGSSIAIDVAKSPEGTKIATLLRGKANEILDEQLKQLKGTK